MFIWSLALLLMAQPAADLPLGLLKGQAAVPLSRAQHECLAFPVDPPNDRLEGPHGDPLVSSKCEVTEFIELGGARPAKWVSARYAWVSTFTAEDPARGKDARDTAKEEEVVLFEVVGPGRTRPVWHARIDAGEYGVWRSVTPEIGATSEGDALLSVMLCVNGTGGCTQDFLHRHADGRWFPVRQTWRDHLPAGYAGRIRHGVRIDPQTLHAEAGFYGDADPNCCPREPASEWADRLITITRLALSSDKSTRGYFHGTLACLSALFTAGRYEELIDS
jgi:hypothetical protein